MTTKEDVERNRITAFDKYAGPAAWFIIGLAALWLVIELGMAAKAGG